MFIPECGGVLLETASSENENLSWEQQAPGGNILAIKQHVRPPTFLWSQRAESQGSWGGNREQPFSGPEGGLGEVTVSK